MNPSSTQDDASPNALTEDEFIPLPEGLEDWDVLSSSTNGNGEVNLLASRFVVSQPELPRRTWEFWDGWRDQLKSFRVYQWDGDAWKHFEVPASQENYGKAISLPGGEWLLTWKWSNLKATGANAHVYVPGAGVVRTFELYPSFTQIEAAPDGTIWVGYDDDTVERYGMNDCYAGSPWDSGLVALSPSGEVLFDFDRLGKGPNAPLPFSHCYALNVVDDHEVWVYYFAEFSLLRLVDHQIKWRWDSIPLPFAGALAIAPGWNLWETVVLGAIEPRHSILYRMAFNGFTMEEFLPVRASGERIHYVEAFSRRNRVFLRHSAGFSIFSVEPYGKC